MVQHCAITLVRALFYCSYSKPLQAHPPPARPSSHRPYPYCEHAALAPWSFGRHATEGEGLGSRAKREGGRCTSSRCRRSGGRRAAGHTACEDSCETASDAENMNVPHLRTHVATTSLFVSSGRRCSLHGVLQVRRALPFAKESQPWATRHCALRVVNWSKDSATYSMRKLGSSISYKLRLFVRSFCMDFPNTSFQKGSHSHDII